MAHLPLKTVAVYDPASAPGKHGNSRNAAPPQNHCKGYAVRRQSRCIDLVRGAPGRSRLLFRAAAELIATPGEIPVVRFHAGTIHQANRPSKNGASPF